MTIVLENTFETHSASGRGVRAIKLFSVTSVLWIAACGAGTSDDGSGFDPDAEQAVERSLSQLVVTGAAWLTTTSPNNALTNELLTCPDCSHNSAGETNLWMSVDEGEYFVVLPKLAPQSGIEWVAHVTPYGSVDASCVINPEFTGGIGDDMYLAVSCTDTAGDSTNTRFSLTYRAIGGPAKSSGDMGFATVRDNSLASYHVSALPEPGFSRSSTGRYKLTFPGLKETDKGGNAQVTSWSRTKHCSVRSWGTSGSDGAFVDVDCYDRAGARSDADFNVSFVQKSIMAGQYGAYVWSGDAGNFNAYTPPAYWNKGMGSLSAGVRRLGTGRYAVNMQPSSTRRFRKFGAMVSAFNDNTICKILDMDTLNVEVLCTRNGNPANSAFSLQVGDRSVGRKEWNLLSGVNFTEEMAAGYGVVCAQVAIQLDQVMCTEPGGAFPRVIGGGLFPNAVRSVAVDNYDATETRVLVLGQDSVLRATSGDLTDPFPALGNFIEQVEVAQPTRWQSGEQLSIRKVIVVRYSGDSNRIIGLTTSGEVIELAGSHWQSTSLAVPSGVTIADISAATDGLHFLTSDGKMYRTQVYASSSQQIQVLPSGLKPLALSGNYAISNANANSNGFVPCKEPADSRGYYDCGTGTNRFFMLTSSGAWFPIEGTNPLPLTNRPDSLEFGNPMTRIPALIDLELFEGGLGENFMAFHHNARIYHRR